ncbi:MAG: hypothetical protein IPO15_11290 [Anaerolineae bacterium]|uniref:hypothetical protein n=1 Tax=Candidatus Amarolinea dominans TaxID=3140696 RepID=UPI0031368251|nr:hypothetical protein [Anaerolineae bacterium]
MDSPALDLPWTTNWLLGIEVICSRGHRPPIHLSRPASPTQPGLLAALPLALAVIWLLGLGALHGPQHSGAIAPAILEMLSLAQALGGDGLVRYVVARPPERDPCRTNSVAGAGRRCHPGFGAPGRWLPGAPRAISFVSPPS